MLFLRPGARTLGLVLGLLLVVRPPLLAAAEPMPMAPELQVPLILKVLTYDRHFEEKAGKEVAIGIVYAPADPGSVAAANQIAAILYRFGGKTVKRLPVRYYMVDYTTPENLERSITQRGIGVLYVSPGNLRNLPGLTRVSQAKGIITTTGVPDYVRRGVSVGIGVSDERPQILINQTSSKAEGSEFDASLLRIATLLK